jgi:hypothetical protein
MDIVKHIKAMCGYDANSYNYLINWCAYIVKYHERTNVAIFLYDPDHSNNKLFIKVLKKLMTNTYGYLTNKDMTRGRDLIGLFENIDDNIFMQKLLIVGNNIVGKDRHDTNYLKYIITRKSYGLNNYVSTFVYNQNNFIFTSTDEIPIKITNFDEMFCYIDCSHYSDATDDILDNVKEFRDYLKSRNLKYFNTTEIPMTKLRKKNIIYHAPAYIYMIYNSINEYKDRTIMSDELYDMCKEYAQEKNMNIGSAKYCFNDRFKHVYGEYYKDGYYWFKDLTKQKMNELIEAKYVYSDEFD